MDKRLNFRNGKFTVLQVSDAQDLHFVRKAMLKMLDKAYDCVKPDLVVFTGDNILGNHLLDNRFGTGKSTAGKTEEYSRMKTALSHILEPLEKRSIPFSAIFGNHDDRNSLTKEEQAELFRSYPCFIGFDNPDKDVRFGSFRLQVFSSDDLNELLNLYMVDSAYCDKEANKCFENVSEDTVEWLNRELTENPEIASMVFQHIPFPEIEELIEECSENDCDSLKLSYHGTEKYIRLRKDIAKGKLCEFVAHTSDNFGEYGVLNKHDNVCGIVFGHDHLNNFEGIIDRLRVIQTPGASFRSYGNRQRGVRVFVFPEQTPAEYLTYTLNYDELCGNSLISRLRYFWDADDYEKKKAALLSAISVMTAFTTTVSALAVIKNKNKKERDR